MKRKYGSKEKFVATTDQIKDANSSKSLQECLDSLPLDAAKKITASAVQDDDGGTPYIETVNGQQSISLIFHNFKGNDGQDGQNGQDGQDGATGPQGPQGDSVLVGQGDLPLAHVLGQDNTKAMSQKGVTDEVTMLVETITQSEIDATGETNYIYTQTNKWQTKSATSFGRVIRIPEQYKGKTIKVTANEDNEARFAFLKSSSTTYSQTPDYCNGNIYNHLIIINEGETYTTVVPDDCAYFYCFGNSSSGKMTPASLEFFEPIKESMSALKNDMSTIEDDISGLETYNETLSKELDMQKITPNATWSEGQLTWIGTKDTSSSFKYSSPIEVKRNDIVYVRGYRQTEFTFLVAWVVDEDKVYDGIYKYPGTSGVSWHEHTFRAEKDGYISVCCKANQTPTITIWRGVDACVDNVMPAYLKVTKDMLFRNNENLFDPANAYDNLKLTDNDTPVTYGSQAVDSWSTGFIRVPDNVTYLRLNISPEKAYAYNANGTKLGNLGLATPINVRSFNGVVYDGVAYIRLCIKKTNLPYTERHRLMVTSFWQETDYKPYAEFDTRFIGGRDPGVFQLSDLASYEAVKVFGTYIDETTFNVDEDAVELDANKVYIDSSTRVLYRYNGEELSKACMWTDRGKVFTQSFNFSIPKTWHKENMIITATAKWVGTTAPTIQLVTSVNGGYVGVANTMKYIIGTKDNYSTKEWRPYNLLIHQDKVIAKITIPAGTTLVVDEFANYYSNRTERETYPMFHYRSGNGLNQGLTAWEEAAKLGYEYIIVIPKRTSDGKWVVFHDDDDINSMYNEGGTSVTNSQPIENYTYAQLLQYDIEGVGLYFRGNKIPLLEDFLALCAKRGIHPVFSVHPNFTTSEWQEVRALTDKWGVTKHLNLKAGYILGNGCLLNTCYSVFGDDVESYYVDINRDGNGVTEVQNAITTFGIDTTKVRVGIEYFAERATEANIMAAREAGIPVGVVTDKISANGAGGNTAADILDWIQMGVSSFTDNINPSVGLNW